MELERPKMVGWIIPRRKILKLLKNSPESARLRS
jgi:hypothetical protein